MAEPTNIVDIDYATYMHTPRKYGMDEIERSTYDWI